MAEAGTAFLWHSSQCYACLPQEDRVHGASCQDGHALERKDKRYQSDGDREEGRGERMTIIVVVTH